MKRDRRSTTGPLGRQFVTIALDSAVSLQVDMDCTGASIVLRGPLVHHPESTVGKREHRTIGQVCAADSCHRNAATVARQLDILTERHRPALIAVTGDAHSIRALQQSVSEPVRALLTLREIGPCAACLEEYAGGMIAEPTTAD